MEVEEVQPTQLLWSVCLFGDDCCGLQYNCEGERSDHHFHHDRTKQYDD